MATDAINTSTAVQTVNAGIGSLATNYQTFLQLLTAQLKNQDPLSPLETNEFTQQLTAMTGVQQQLLTNQLLTQMISQGQLDISGSAVNLIGKQVTAENPNVTLTDGKAEFSYSLGAEAASSTIEIVNANGQVVYSTSGKDNAEGPHKLVWNGRNSNGKQMPDGDAYAIRVTAKDADGNKIATGSSVTGVVNRVENIDGQTILTIGAAKALLSSITSVSVAPTEQADNSTGQPSS